tara:strand:- start:1891 stop:2175 length:285 start_codon:yes stop_codon:yes gene_type:complete
MGKKGNRLYHFQHPLPYKVMYEETEQIKKQNTSLLKEVQVLLIKIAELTKLVNELTNILLSYNPKVAEQTKEQLEKINDETDDKGTEPRGDIPG